MKKLILILALVFVALYIAPLGDRPMIVPDECRYAEIPREMIAAGDWIVPRLDGLRYFEKPVLGYWLVAASMKAFGETAFAARLPSALAAGLSALGVLLLGWRLRREAGVLAAAILLTALESFGLGIYNVLDGPLSAFLTLAMTCFFLAYSESRPRRRAAWLAAFGAFCGFAFLTKGFLAFAVPVVAIVPFLAWERRWSDLLRLPWIPAIVAAIIAAPWCVAIHLREPDYWHYFFWIEHIKRFTAERAQHANPFWFYIPVLLLGFLPWTALLPAAARGLRGRFQDPLLRFALCWFAFPFLFFSAASGKIATYILPCYAPLALLTAAGLDSELLANRNRRITLGALAVALVPFAAAVALVVNQLTGIPGIRAFLPGELGKWVLLVSALSLWATLAAAAALAARPTHKIALFIAGPLVLLVSAHHVMPEQFIVKKAPGAFLVSQAAAVAPDTRLISDNDMVHAVCWFYKRSDVYLFDSKGELEYGLSYPDSARRFLDESNCVAMAREAAARTVIITITNTYEDWTQRLPAPAAVASGGKPVMAEFGTQQHPPR